MTAGDMRRLHVVPKKPDTEPSQHVRLADTRCSESSASDCRSGIRRVLTVCARLYRVSVGELGLVELTGDQL